MSTDTTQVIHVHEYGGPEQLRLEREQRPEPQAGEVLLRVYAAGVNPVDWKIRQGLAKDVLLVPLPYVPGFDVAGVVEAVGPGVTAFQPGQEVFGQSRAYAQYTTASVAALALKPETLTFDEAATIPTGATTAWQALFEVGDLRAGQRVLIQDAAGGVGLFAAQFAAMIGAQVIGTASTANVDFVRSLGVETVIDYTSTPFERVAHQVNLVLDTVGGEVANRSMDVVKRDGRLVWTEGLGVDRPSQEKAQQLGIQFLVVLAQPTSELLHTFAQLIDQGKIQVAVGTIFPLHAASQAHTLCQSGHGRGRIVLHID